MLKSLIKEILLAEDFDKFLKRTSYIYYNGDSFDPTFEFTPRYKKYAREVKRIWQEEADHEFMKSLIKIHWISSQYGNPENMLENFFKMKKNNEVAAMGYLPNTEIDSIWGPVGVKIEGRVTLAANDMNSIVSGYGGQLFQNVHSKYKSSGTPKRATAFSHEKALNYILDRESFNPQDAGSNELIVANWRITGFVFRDLNEYSLTRQKKLLSSIIKFSKLLNLPIYDHRLSQISINDVENVLAGW